MGFLNHYIKLHPDGTSAVGERTEQGWIVAERIGVERGKRSQREATKNNSCKKKRDRPVANITESGDQGQGGGSRYGKAIDKHDWTGKKGKSEEGGIVWGEY